MSRAASSLLRGPDGVACRVPRRAAIYLILSTGRQQSAAGMTGRRQENAGGLVDDLAAREIDDATHDGA